MNNAFAKFGLLLKLVNIQENTDFTCVVTDDRAAESSATDAADKKKGNEPETAVTVSVYVANGKKDVCNEQGRHSPIFLQFFYLFSIFFLNCF
jgi:hypothetical protein